MIREGSRGSPRLLLEFWMEEKMQAVERKEIERYVY